MTNLAHAVYITLGILLLVAVGFRWRSLLRHGVARPLTIALLFLGLFCFLATTPVKNALNDALNHGGLTASVLKNAAVWWVAVNVLWLISVVRHPHRRRTGPFWVRVAVIAAGAVVMLSPLVTADPGLRPDGVRAGVYEAAWGGWLYWLINNATPLWACFEAARLTIGNARRATSALRTGLVLIAAGTSIGVALLALRTVQMIRLATGGGEFPFYLTAITDGVAVCVALIGLGSCYHAIVPWIRRRSAEHRYRRQYAALQPLWAALHDPGAAVATFTPAAGERFTAPRLLLVRRVIEIRDGILNLRPYMSPGVRADASQLLRALPPEASGDQAAITAAEIIAAQRVSRLGTAVADQVPRGDDTDTGEDTIASEVRWLLEVTSWYTQVPALAQEPAA